MIVIPLMENSSKKTYFNEKGLSLYIETGNKKIIFDMGISAGYLKNMKKLGIVLNEIDYFIISHGHKDHIGGLINILDEIEPSKVYMSPEALNNFSFNILGIEKNIGLTKKHLEILKKFKVNMIKNNYYQIDEGIVLFRGDKRENSSFYNRNDKRDDFIHELQLIVEKNKELNIITGCSHFGIANIVSEINKNFPDKKIGSILGGLHTRSYLLTPWKLVSLIKFLRDSNITSYYLGHCTGRIVRRILKKTLGNVHNLQIGNRIEL